MRPMVSAELLHGRGVVNFWLAVSEMLGGICQSCDGKTSLPNLEYQTTHACVL
jgi:hypothetical protein